MDLSDSIIGNDQYRYAENVRLVSGEDNNGGELHTIDGTIPARVRGDIQFSEDAEILASTSIREYGIVVVKEPVLINHGVIAKFSIYPKQTIVSEEDHNNPYGYDVLYDGVEISYDGCYDLDGNALDQYQTLPRAVDISYKYSCIYDDDESLVNNEDLLNRTYEHRFLAGTPSGYTYYGRMFAKEGYSINESDGEETISLQTRQFHISEIRDMTITLLSRQDTLNSVQINSYASSEKQDVVGSQSDNNQAVYKLQEWGWSIYRYTNDPYSMVRIFGPCTEQIWGENNKLSLAIAFESENNIKLYIADGIHQIMTFDVIKYQDEDGQPYTNISYATRGGWTPSFPLKLEIIENQNSQLKPAKVQYCFQLKRGNETTNVSCLSEPITLYADNNFGFRGLDANTDSYAGLPNVNKSIKLTLDTDLINSADQEYIGLYDKIIIYRLTYIANGKAPEIHELQEQDFSTSFTHTDNGEIYDSVTNGYLGLKAKDYSKKVPKLITSHKNFLFLANIKDTQEIVDQEFEDVDVRCWSSGMYEENGEIKHRQFDSPNSQWNYKWWYKTNSYQFGGNGEYFSWNYKFSDESYVLSYQNLQENDDTHVTTFRPGEVYRFGVILYNLKGFKSSVKWIADIMIPDENVDAYNIVGDEYSTVRNRMIYFENGNWHQRPLYIEFHLNKPIPNCSKYEIVRCSRSIDDKYIISQGFIGNTFCSSTCKIYDQDLLYKYADDSNTVCPTGYMTMCDQGVSNVYMYEVATNSGSSIRVPYNEDDTSVAWYARTTNQLVQFASPECAYSGGSVQKILDNNKGSVSLDVVHNYSVPKKQKPFYNPDSNGADSIMCIGYDTSWFNQTDNREQYFFNLAAINEDSVESYYRTREYMYTPYRIRKDNVQGSNDVVIDVVAFYNGNSGDNAITKTHIIPNANSSNNEIVNTKYKILDAQCTKVPDPKSFGSGTLPDINNISNIINIHNKSFMPWSSPVFGGIGSTGFNSSNRGYTGLNEFFADGKYTNVNYEGESVRMHRLLFPYWVRCISTYPIGTCGTCILLWLDRKARYTNALDVTIANIKKGSIPYSGYNKAAINKSDYHSYGNIYTNEVGDHIIDTGDAYIKMFTYNASHAWDGAPDSTSPAPRRVPKLCTIYSVPLISDVDVQGEYGFRYGKNSQYPTYIQDSVVTSLNGYSQDFPCYLYNDAYSMDQFGTNVSVENKRDSIVKNYDTRIVYSNAKEFDELEDRFLEGGENSIDVDSQYGEITGLTSFNDRLIFWQNKAAGICPVNERVLLQNASDTDLLLGTGGVLDRFDYFTTRYGMKPAQNAYCASDRALYWWDGYNKKILSYSVKKNSYGVSAGVIELSDNGIKTYLNNNEEVHRPFLMYDPTYHEVVCGCVNNESVVYNEPANAFTSIYKFLPTSSTTVEGVQYVTSNNDIYLYNKSDNNWVKLFENNVYPSVQFVVNKNFQQVKTYDIQTLGLRSDNSKNNIVFNYKTSLNQEGRADGSSMTNREYDYRINIPRAGSLQEDQWVTELYGNRLKGKTLNCTISLDTNNAHDFSLQYVTTKYRISYS